MVLCGGAVGGKWQMCGGRIIARCMKERCGEWGSGSCTRWCKCRLARIVIEDAAWVLSGCGTSGATVGVWTDILKGVRVASLVAVLCGAPRGKNRKTKTRLSYSSKPRATLAAHGVAARRRRASARRGSLGEHGSPIHLGVAGRSKAPSFRRRTVPPRLGTPEHGSARPPRERQRPAPLAGRLPLSGGAGLPRSRAARVWRAARSTAPSPRPQRARGAPRSAARASRSCRGTARR